MPWSPPTEGLIDTLVVDITDSDDAGDIDGVRRGGARDPDRRPVQCCHTCPGDTEPVTLQIFALTGIGPVHPGDDLTEILTTALQPLAPEGGDVLVVTHKIVSKAEGRVVAIEGDEEIFRRALVESEAVSVVRRRGDLIIAETEHGFICANAGVDRSNAEPGTMILLPGGPGPICTSDPDPPRSLVRDRHPRHHLGHLRTTVAAGTDRYRHRGLGPRSRDRPEGHQ